MSDERLALVATLSRGHVCIHVTEPMTVDTVDELIEYLTVYRASLEKRAATPPNPDDRKDRP